MADRITDDRLREIATSDPLVLAICAQMGEPSWADMRATAAELLAARNKIRADEEHLPTIGRLTEDLYRTEHDLDAARAEVERLRSRVGWLDHLDTPEGRAMHATEAVRVENEQLRADLREAMELLQAHGEPPNWLRQAWLRREPGDDTTAFHTWNRRYGALLAKHKETNQ